MEIDKQNPEEQRISELNDKISYYYDNIPMLLRHAPEIQEKCMNFLLDAERQLVPPTSRDQVIWARLALTRIEIEIKRARSSGASSAIVLLIVYMFIGAIAAAFYFNLLQTGTTADALNKSLIMGIPLPVLVWSVIGSLTSMLLRAGQLPFDNINDGIRWVLFRPIVGVVMGILTYLMVTAGLIVFAGSGQSKTPELLWVIAFIGSFSDNLSINLLHKIIGEFRVHESKDKSKSREAKKEDNSNEKGK
jgi:hypothetical protein